MPSNRDHIEINVGGTTFHCSKVTLCTNATYFKSRLSSPYWDDDEAIFIDQDPVSFQVLLNYMRHGYIKQSEITDFVLTQADFFGFDSLVKAAKCDAFQYMHPHESPTLSESEMCFKFDKRYGGIVSAVKHGILPNKIQPSAFGRKEYVHLGISAHATVTPAETRNIHLPGDQALPCLMTKIIGPPYLGKVLNATPLSQGTPNLHPTLIDAMNWLHKHGFVTREYNFSHISSDLLGDNRADQTFMALQDHLWFSRIEKEKNSGNMRESPIMYDRRLVASSDPILVRREFAALVSFASRSQNGGWYEDIIITSTGGEPRQELVVADSGFEIARMLSSSSYAYMKCPVNWLGKEGYTRREDSLTDLCTKMFRAGCKICRGWQERELDKVRATVFSREFQEEQEESSSSRADESNTEVSMRDNV